MDEDKIQYEKTKLEEDDSCLGFHYGVGPNRQSDNIYEKILDRLIARRRVYKDRSSVIKIKWQWKTETPGPEGDKRQRKPETPGPEGDKRQRKPGTIVAGTKGTFKWTLDNKFIPVIYEFFILDLQLVGQKAIRIYLRPKANISSPEKFSPIRLFDEILQRIFKNPQEQNEPLTRSVLCDECCGDGDEGFFKEFGLNFRPTDDLQECQNGHSLNEKHRIIAPFKPLSLKHFLRNGIENIEKQPFSELKASIVEGHIDEGEQIWIYRDKETAQTNPIARLNPYAHVVVYTGPSDEAEDKYEVVHVIKDSVRCGTINGTIVKQDIDQVILPDDLVFLGHQIPEYMQSTNIRGIIKKRALACAEPPKLVFPYSDKANCESFSNILLLPTCSRSGGAQKVRNCFVGCLCSVLKYTQSRHKSKKRHLLAKVEKRLEARDLLPKRVVRKSTRSHDTGHNGEPAPADDGRRPARERAGPSGSRPLVRDQPHQRRPVRQPLPGGRVRPGAAGPGPALHHQDAEEHRGRSSGLRNPTMAPVPFHSAGGVYSTVPTFGWKSGLTSGSSQVEDSKDVFSEDLTNRLKEAFLHNLCQRPAVGLTEVRRDGKDTAAVAKVITKEFHRWIEVMGQEEFVSHMHTYTKAAWATMESLHQQMMEDDQPENERVRLDPDHWYEINLTNAALFANLCLEGVSGLEQLVPGRLFTTRMPRNIVEDPREKQDFVDKCKTNQLEVIFVLTEAFEFKKYSGMEGLLKFYTGECGLTDYNRAIPDFEIPTSGDLVNNILDITHHLAKGDNCLIHCAGGTGRTGMVVAAIVQNLGVYDAVSRIRKVKSTYVETKDQEIFLKNMPKVIDKRIIADKPQLARAIAAEHLIQVFHTHGAKIRKAEDQDEARVNLDNMVEPLDDEEEKRLIEAYGETFDLIDNDRNGVLDMEELEKWFAMCGAEIDTSKMMEVLLGEKCLTRERFSKLMCSSARTNRREYDIGTTE